MLGLYILDDDGNPVPCADGLKWGNWFGTSDRRVAADEIDDATVSTVFVAMDLSFGLGGPPQLYETMIFGGPHDQHTERYATREEALEGHRRAVRMCSEPGTPRSEETDEDPPKEIDWFAHNRS